MERAPTELRALLIKTEKVRGDARVSFANTDASALDIDLLRRRDLALALGTLFRDALLSIDGSQFPRKIEPTRHRSRQSSKKRVDSLCQPSVLTTRRSKKQRNLRLVQRSQPGLPTRDPNLPRRGRSLSRERQMCGFVIGCRQDSRHWPAAGRMPFTQASHRHPLGLADHASSAPGRRLRLYPMLAKRPGEALTPAFQVGLLGIETHAPFAARLHGQMHVRVRGVGVQNQ